MAIGLEYARQSENNSRSSNQRKEYRSSVGEGESEATSMLDFLILTRAYCRKARYRLLK